MKQIKCYCGHTTYCDCGPLEEPRKQTAVEWLVEQIKSDQNQKALSLNEWMQVIEQTKAMEKENQLDLIRFLRTQDKMGKSVEDLLEQFKSEQDESNTGI